ncbi:MAG: choice-of-anchor L domain-containing protein [Bacteroidales bacterium]|jgi:gliding motility-associated-like protein|nr:choice-of-anchor L domain-containing protein [Bacteroidales bacterium]
MKKIRRIFVLAFIIVVLQPICVFSQVTTTQVNGQMTAKELIEEYFVGEGIHVKNVSFKKADTNSLITSNQIGYFANADTNGAKIKATQGIVMATSAIDCSVGTGSSTANNSWNAMVGTASQYSQLLANVLLDMCFATTSSMNNIAVLSFDFMAEGDEVSFQYCFYSEEYPNFVCSNVNDAFGFFITGPTEISVPMEEILGGANIARIPGTETDYSWGDPVTINSVNGGGHSAVTNCSNPGTTIICIPTNTQWFTSSNIEGFGSSSTYQGGCTKLLETRRVTVRPCVWYHLELAICNVGDQAYQSAVFLQANSLKTNRFRFDNIAEGLQGGGDRFAKGCSQTIIKLSRSTYDKPLAKALLFAGDAVRGQDYEIVDMRTNTPITGNATSSYVNFNEGDSVVDLQVRFLDRDPNEPVGNEKTLQIYTDDAATMPCSPTAADTITMIMYKPAGMQVQMSEDKAYCNYAVPNVDTLLCNTLNTYGEVVYEWSYGYNPYDSINYCHFDSASLPMDIILKVTDECARTYDTTRTFIDTIHIIKNVPYIKAFINAPNDKDTIICEGDSLQIHVTESDKYEWYSAGGDPVLVRNYTKQNPYCEPHLPTYIYVLATDTNQCQARDSVFVSVVPQIKASMLLNPTDTSFLAPNIYYEDNTPLSTEWYWDFGDGTFSTQQQGMHTYTSGDTGTYNVMLIASNEACTDTARGKIRLYEMFTIYLPTALLAGENGINGVFRPYGSAMTYYELSIYDRWGGRMYFTNKLGDGWDGKRANGEYAPEGTYVYVLNYKDGNGIMQLKQGTLTLVRYDKK